jgi:hypothetical protein
VGGFLSSSADRALLTAFVKRAHSVSIDIQFQACDAIDGSLAQATALLQYIIEDKLPVPGNASAALQETEGGATGASAAAGARHTVPERDAQNARRQLRKV